MGIHGGKDKKKRKGIRATYSGEIVYPYLSYQLRNAPLRRSVSFPALLRSKKPSTPPKECRYCRSATTNIGGEISNGSMIGDQNIVAKVNNGMINTKKHQGGKYLNIQKPDGDFRPVRENAEGFTRRIRWQSVGRITIPP